MSTWNGDAGSPGRRCHARPVSMNSATESRPNRVTLRSCSDVTDPNITRRPNTSPAITSLSRSGCARSDPPRSALVWLPGQTASGVCDVTALMPMSP